MKYNSKAFTRLLTLGMLSGSLFTNSSFINGPEPKPPLTGTINISGTRFLFPLIEKWAEEFKRENPGVEIVVKFGIASRDIEATATPVRVKNPEKGQYTVVSRFALVPIVNEKNPALNELQKKGITKNDFEKIYFKGDHPANKFVMQSGLDVPIRVYARGACASATFTGHFGKEIKDLSNLDTKIADDKALLQNVLNDSLGVAYNNLGFVYDLETRKQKQGIRVVPVDINANGKVDKEEEFYESLDQLIQRLEVSQSDLPPTGNMVFIYKEDKPEVKTFVKWILEKGQHYNHSLGFLNRTSSNTAQR